MTKNYWNWLSIYQRISVVALKNKADKLWNDTVFQLCALIEATPPELMGQFIDSEHWLDDYRVLKGIDVDNLSYQEEDVDETFKTPLEDTPQEILKGIIDCFLVFAATVAKKERRLI